MSLQNPTNSGQSQPKIQFEMKPNSQTIDSVGSQNVETQLNMEEPGSDTLQNSISEQDRLLPQHIEKQINQVSDAQIKYQKPSSLIPPSIHTAGTAGNFMNSDQLMMQEDQDKTHASVAGQSSNATTGYMHTNLAYQRPKAFEQFHDSQDSIITSMEHSMILNAASNINQDKSTSIQALKAQHKKQLVKQFARKYKDQALMEGNETQRFYHQSMGNPMDEQMTLNTSRYGMNQQHEKYKRPYPGYAFPFENIDSYTTRKKLSTGRSWINRGNSSERDPMEHRNNRQINVQAFSPKDPSKISGLQTSKYEDTTRGANSLFYNQSFGGEGTPQSQNRYTTKRKPNYQGSSFVQDSNQFAQEHSSQYGPNKQNSLFASNQISEMDSHVNENNSIEKTPQQLPQIKFHILNNSVHTAYSLKGPERVFSQESKDRVYYKRGAEHLAEKLQQLNSQQRPIPQTQGMNRRMMNLDFNNKSLMQASKDSGVTSMTQRGSRRLAPLQASVDSTSSNENLMKSRKKSHKPVSLTQAQKFKVRGNKLEYEYKPKQNEFTENMLTFSGDNRFRERTNPTLARFINGLQGNIKMDTERRKETNQKAQKIFDMMKSEKKRYIETLRITEKKGHCTGIEKRLDPTIRIQQKTQQEKYERQKQDNLEKVQQQKKQRDKEKTNNQRQRVQQKINIINSHIITRSKREQQQGPNSFLNSFQTQKSNLKQKALNTLNQAPDQFSYNQNRDSMARGDFTSPQSVQGNRNVQFTFENCDATPSPIKEAENTNNNEIELLVDQRQLDESPMLDEELDVELIDADEMKKDKLVIKPQRSLEDTEKLTTHAAQKISQKKRSTISSGNKANTILEALQLNKKSQITKSQRDKIELTLKHDSEGPLAIIYNQFKIEQKSLPAKKKDTKNDQNQASGAVPGKPQKKKDILHAPEDLKIGVLHENPRLNEDYNYQEFFRSMCQIDSSKQPKIPSIRNAVLNKEVFEKFLQDRYSPNIGKNIILYLESDYSSLFGATFSRFLSILVEFLNDGRESYKRMLFASLSLSNPGRICEHDVFTILEQFKQKESFFFYQDLIMQKDVPRDYSTICDTSDQIFFDVFAQDLKTISQIINLQKRMIGVIDTDTNLGIENDFAFKDYPGTKDQYEQDLIIQIIYILNIIMKRKDAYWWSYQGDQRNPSDRGAFEILVESKSLQEIRNRLCLLVASHKLMEGGNARKLGSSLSTYSDISSTSQKPTAQSKRNQSPGSKAKQLNFFRAPVNVDPCLGSGCFAREGHKDKKISDCIYITYNEFNKLFNARRALKKSTQGIPKLAVDFIKTVTLGLFDLRVFETQYGDCREHGGPKSPFVPKSIDAQAQLKETSSKKEEKRTQLSSKKTKTGEINIKSMNKTGQKMTNVAQYQEPLNDDLFYQTNHEISHHDKFDKQDQRIGGGEFNILLSRNPNPKRCSKMNFDDDSKAPGEDLETNIVLISGDQVRELNGFKEHFGIKNFYNIFWCFYTLANVPVDCENNIFAPYIDEFSIKRGFKTVFGIDNEEVHLRFFNLFINPMGKPKMFKIDINRFFFVAQMICDCPENKNHGGVSAETTPTMQMAFRFYDYDNNGDIGSVDIQNILKQFDQMLVDQIENNHYEILKRKEELKHQDPDESIEIRPPKVIKKEIKKFQKLTMGPKKDPDDSESIESSDDSSSSEDVIAANAWKSKQDMMQDSREINSSVNSEDERKEEEASFRGSELNNSQRSKVSKAQSNNMNNLRENDASDLKQGIAGTIKRAVFQQQKKIYVPKFDPYAQLSKEGQMILSNPWNEVIFEVRQLRNYFVEKAVIPAQQISASGQNFLNVKQFENKFCAYLDKYEVSLSKPLPSQKPDEKSNLKMPAICNFFRQRFICDSRDHFYGQNLFIKISELEAQASGLQVKGQSSINVYFNMLNSQTFDPMDLMIQELGYGKEITEAFCEMAIMLNKCSQVPRLSAPVVTENS